MSTTNNNARRVRWAGQHTEQIETPTIKVSDGITATNDDSDVESVVSINSGLGEEEDETQESDVNNSDKNSTKSAEPSNGSVESSDSGSDSDSDSDSDSEENPLDGMEREELQQLAQRFQKMKTALANGPGAENYDKGKKICGIVKFCLLQAAADFGDTSKDLRQQLSNVNRLYLEKDIKLVDTEMDNSMLQKNGAYLEERVGHLENMLGESRLSNTQYQDKQEELLKLKETIETNNSQLKDHLAESQKSRIELITMGRQQAFSFGLKGYDLIKAQTQSTQLRFKLANAEKECAKIKDALANAEKECATMKDALVHANFNSDVEQTQLKKIINDLTIRDRLANQLHANTAKALRKMVSQKDGEIQQLRHVVTEQNCTIRKLLVTTEKKEHAHELLGTAFMKTAEEAKLARELELAALKEQHAAQLAELEGRLKQAQKWAAEIIFGHLDEIKKLQKKADVCEEDSVNEINNLKSELIYARGACHMAEKQHEAEEEVLKKRAEKVEKRLAHLQAQIEEFVDEFE